MRLRSGPIRLVAIPALFAAGLLMGGAQATLAQEGTPVAGTPVAEEPVAEATTPAIEPASTNVVTLVAWYSNDPSGEFLNVLPIRVGEDHVASADPNGDPLGRAEFPSPEVGLPYVTIGDTTFNAYLRYEFDIAERWIWTDDTEGFRPATLVIQVQGEGGTYANYYGTATFISRDDLAGGVVVLALRPPEPAAVQEAAAEEAVAEEAAAEETAVEEAPVEEAPVEEAPVEEAPVEEAPVEEAPVEG
jgi:hypothetical protein